MDESPQVRRILRLHGAHRTVGVAGVASPFCAIGSQIPVCRPERAARTILLISGHGDRHGRAARRAFERIINDRGDVRCQRVDVSNGQFQGLAKADCAVFFGRCLQIAGHWTAFDSEGLVEELVRHGRFGSQRIEIADAARWHPLVEGVGPFTIAGSIGTVVDLPADATPLLSARSGGKVRPMAWARHGDNPSMCSLLGRSSDFERPEFVRLVLNAIEWLSR